jgi:CRISPR-associated protein Csb2
VRHATADIYQAMPECLSFVHGHDAEGKQLRGPDADKRLMFLPLPTINHALGRVESIRRVLIAAPPGDTKSIDFIRRRLASHELHTPDSEVVGVLNHFPAWDWVVRQYTGVSRVWSTVTPVILPGHDDRDPRKAEGLLRKAMVQSGLSREVVAGVEALHWRLVGFRAGTELALRYLRPEQPRGPVYHVQVRFGQAVVGPLAVGAGRYRGFGLFAAEGDSA